MCLCNLHTLYDNSFCCMLQIDLHIDFDNEVAPTLGRLIGA